MVKLLDFKISAWRLVLRVLIALLLSALSLSALYLVPTIIMYYTRTVPSAALQDLMNQLLDSRVLYIGLLVSVFVLVTMTLRKTKLEGPLLICLGASLLAYWILIFHGGTLNIQIPVTELQQSLGYSIPLNITATLNVSLTTLLLIVMLTPLLIIVKGALLALVRIRKD